MKAPPSKEGAMLGGLGVLTVLLVGLELAHVIEWPWLWVLAPLWFPCAVLVLIVIAAGAVLWAFALGVSVFYLLPVYVVEALKRRGRRR
jgi:hypothetical protein